MGCSESKGKICTLPPIAQDNAASNDTDEVNTGGRRPSLSVVRQSSSNSLLKGSARSVFKTPNNNHLIDNTYASASLVTNDLGSAGSSGRGSKPQTPPDEEEFFGSSQNGGLPGSTGEAPISSISGRIPSALEHIPTSDLGESLDVRRAMRLFKSHSMMQLGSGSSRSAPSNGLVSMFNEHAPPPDSAAFEHTSHSAKSGDSGDSGISDPGPGEDYSFVITENSPSELVRRVEQEFVPVENINLIITGKACSRMLSGYQKTRIEEEAILESLREEGFIATSKTKSAGGMAFEVMEATPQALSAGSKTNPQDFLPSSAIKKMEERRNKFGPGDRTSEDVLQKWQEAQRRREAEIEARQEKMAELRKGTEGEKKKMEELAMKQENKTDAALQKREAHLKELRDKLRAQNQHAQQVKLKKLVNAPPVPVPMSRGASASYGGPTTDIFFG